MESEQIVRLDLASLFEGTLSCVKTNCEPVEGGEGGVCILTMLGPSYDLVRVAALSVNLISILAYTEGGQVS